MLLLPAAAIAQDTYSLKGSVGKWDAPSKVFMYYEDAKGENRFDSSDVKNGNFEFHGSVDKARKASLLLTYNKVKFKFFMEVLLKVRNEEDFKNASLDVLNFYLEPGETSITSADSLYKATVKGSVRNTDLSALNHARTPVYNDMKNIIFSFNDAASKGEFDEKSILKMEADYKKDIELLKQTELSFAKTHTSSVISLDILDKYVGSESVSQVTGPLFNALNKNIKTSPQGKALQEQIAQFKLLDIGAMAPAFSQTDTSGNMVSLSSFKGRYVLVDFWASWCSPCRAENPTVVRAYNDYNKKNFTIVGISLDRPDGRSRWLKAIADDKLPWTQLSDLKGGKNEVAVLYHVKEIPQNFLVGPDGRIVARNLHGNALWEKLATLLN
ncbi:TlpA disulfide reductase family protein [Chitinophaga oryziterrae]